MGGSDSSSLVAENQREALRKLIAGASSELLFVSPFVTAAGIEIVHDLLQAEGKMDIDRQLVFPRPRRVDDMQFLQFDALKAFKEAGGKLRYIQELLHAKIYVADDAKALITSANLTEYGFPKAGARGNTELGVVRPVDEQLASWIAQLLTGSCELTEKQEAKLETFATKCKKYAAKRKAWDKKHKDEVPQAPDLAGPKSSVDSGASASGAGGGSGSVDTTLAGTAFAHLQQLAIDEGAISIVRDFQRKAAPRVKGERSAVGNRYKLCLGAKKKLCYVRVPTGQEHKVDKEHFDFPINKSDIDRWLKLKKVYAESPGDEQRLDGVVFVPVTRADGTKRVLTAPGSPPVAFIEFERLDGLLKKSLKLLMRGVKSRRIYFQPRDAGRWILRVPSDRTHEEFELKVEHGLARLEK